MLFWISPRIPVDDISRLHCSDFRGDPTQLRLIVQWYCICIEKKWFEIRQFCKIYRVLRRFHELSVYH